MGRALDDPLGCSLMDAGKHTLRSGKLHLPRKEGERFREVIRPGDRFDATEAQLEAFGDIIVTYETYLALVSDKVVEVAGGDIRPTDKPKVKRKSRAKTAKEPGQEPEDEGKPDEDSEPEPELIE